MKDFEEGALYWNTPCRLAEHREMAEALAVVHAEFILIHPFREGNGRVARLLALLMGLQAGLPPLDFSPMLRQGKVQYIKGIHSALAQDYKPLTAIFEQVILKTLKKSAASSTR